MKMLRAFKTELDLNNVQKTACIKHAGAARFAYNWGLARKIEAYKNGSKTPNAIDLHRELNTLKKTELSWMYDVSKAAPQEALRNLDTAFAQFFRRIKEKKAGKKIKAGYPCFKSKKNKQESFRLTGTIRIFDKSIQLPRLGQLRLKERGYLPVNTRILSATVSQHAQRWYVSVLTEVEIPDITQTKKPVVGVDLGTKRLATVSDGMVVGNPRVLKRSLKKIAYLHRRVSSRQIGSANYKKAVHRLAKAHAHVANIRKNHLHHVTSLLAKTKSAVVLENLQISKMLKNHKLALAVSDVGMYEFRRQMSYKGAWYGCEIFLADPYFPSTKRCSECGYVKPRIGLSEREYVCEQCGTVLDRDLNAAINLKQLFYLEYELPQVLREVMPVESM